MRTREVSTYPNLASASPSELDADRSSAKVRRHGKVRDAAHSDDYQSDLMKDPRAARGLEDTEGQGR